MNPSPPAGARSDEPVTHEEVWLLGQPPLGDYLSFVKDRAIGGAQESPAALTDEWRRANDYYQELEDTELGIADQAGRRDLDPRLAPLAAEVMAHPYCRRTFDTLPTTIEMVEVEKLIVCQRSVTWTFVERVKTGLGHDPDPEALFRFCLPLDDREQPVQVRREGSRRYVFRSESMDLRYHGTTLFRPDQIADHEAFGPMAGIVGVVVGFGSNFLNVIRADHRMVLHNGYHRACALLALGIQYAPAIVQTVSRGEELEITAKDSVSKDPDFYFRSARPPLLKDFLDPRIRRVLRIPSISRVVEVTYDVRDYDVSE